LDDALKLSPNRADLYATRGGIRAARQNDAGALEDFSKAIELQPTFYFALTSRAELSSKQDPQAGLRDADQAIRLNPERPEGFFSRGRCRKALGQVAQAKADYTRAIELAPHWGSPYGFRAFCREDADVDAVVNDLNKAIELGANSAGIYIRRANIHLDQNRPLDAISDATKAHELDPQEYFHLFIRGRAYWRIDQNDAAAEDFSAALRLKPLHAHSLLYRSKIAFSKRDYLSAIVDAEALLAPAADPLQGHIMLAHIYAGCPDQMIRNAAKALEHAKSACELSQNKDVDALAAMAAACAEAGDYDNAVMWQDRVIDITPVDQRASAKAIQDQYRNRMPLRL
jgi:serine/threonine-protein kinase